MAAEVRVAVIGVGRIGRLHARNLAYHIPRANLCALSDVNGEALASCAQELDVRSAAEDYRVVLEKADVDAVVISSSTDTHSQIIEEAAAAGKHIFCEKPIDLDLSRIDRALAAVESAGVKVQVGFNRRFDPSFCRARAMVAEGKVGKPHQLRITSRDPEPPPLDYVKRSGGIFLDMTIHDFDMARYLMGCEVEEVFAAGGVLVDRKIGAAGDIDTATITLRFQNGAIGVIENSRRAVFGYDQRVEVFGSDGMVTVSNAAPDSAALNDCAGVHGPLPRFFFLDRYVESYVAEMMDFVECILGETDPPVTGRDGRIPVVMGYAARKSYEENRPVRLSEIAPI